MNSQRIRETFGSYAVEVLWQTPELRVASLASIHRDVSVCRTLAVTEFILPVAAPLLEAHNAIIAGASIGETFVDRAIATQKVDDRWFTLPAGDHFSLLTRGTVVNDTVLSVRVYRLQARINNWQDYAVIAEAYHPDHICKPIEVAAPSGVDIAAADNALAVLASALQSSPNAKLGG